MLFGFNCAYIFSTSCLGGWLAAARKYNTSSWRSPHAAAAVAAENVCCVVVVVCCGMTTPALRYCSCWQDADAAVAALTIVVPVRRSRGVRAPSDREPPPPPHMWISFSLSVMLPHGFGKTSPFVSQHGGGLELGVGLQGFD